MSTYEGEHTIFGLLGQANKKDYFKTHFFIILLQPYNKFDADYFLRSLSFSPKYMRAREGKLFIYSEGSVIESMK
jgi:hypothetical protein